MRRAEQRDASGGAVSDALPLPGRYRHYKGGLYTVLHHARHSETEEWLVVYRAEADDSLWVRPRAMWIECVMRDGVPVPRFAMLPGDEAG